MLVAVAASTAMFVAMATSPSIATTPLNAAATVSPAAAGDIEVDEASSKVTMCGVGYCAELDVEKRAVLTSLEVGSHELLDPQVGMYSSVRTEDGAVSSRRLDADPTLSVKGNTVLVEFETSVTDETWRFQVTPQQLRYRLTRTYRDDLTLREQGTPRIGLAENAIDQLRWPEDGGNFPVGGQLVNTHQESWLAAGANFNPRIRTAKRQISYDLLDSATQTALSIKGSTGDAAAPHSAGTEVWRSQEADGAKVLNLAAVTASEELRFKGPNPLGYGYQTKRDGSPVFKPVSVEAGETEEVSLVLRPRDHDSFYDLGTLNGVDEEHLSRAINNYARWMMQDVDKGASTEQPQLQSEVPPLEMHWIIQLLELFPEPGAIRSLEVGLEDIRDHLQRPSGKVFCCYPGMGSVWGHDYGDHASGYAIAVARLYQLTGDDRWLRSMSDSVEKALDYMVEEWTDPTTHFVRNVDPALDEADYNNDYWESSSGQFNGYTTVLLYDALTRWADMHRDLLDQPSRADRLDALADTIKHHVNKPVSQGGFWSPATETYLYGTGNEDALYLPMNAAVLKTDIAPRERARKVVQAIEEQNAAGNYDLDPMNVQDLYQPGTIARTAGKGGENGGWYGAPNGDYYAGMPILGDPRLLQTKVASFLTRYQADGFHGATAWDREKPLSSTAAGVWFPTTVMPAWGLYHYGYGFQPQADRLVLAPFIAPQMAGSQVRYTWRQTPLEVTYESAKQFLVDADGPLPTPVEIQWINQTPSRAYRVSLGDTSTTVRADAHGVVSAVVPAGTEGAVRASCEDCVTGSAGESADGRAVTGVDVAGVEVRNDRYEQVGMQVAVGPRPVTITDLGRFKAPGNSDVHRVKILDVDGRVVASAPVDMARDADRDGFVLASLSAPVELEPGIYYVYTSETPNGDVWYAPGSSFDVGDGVTVLGAAQGRDRAVTERGTTSYGPTTFAYRQHGEAEPWMQTLVDPSSVRARSGQTFTLDVTVWGQADDPIDGMVKADLPDGWTSEPVAFTVPTRGEVAKTTVPLSITVAPRAATATYTPRVTASSSDGLSSSRDVEAVVANILYDFDDGTVQGWQSEGEAGDPRAVTSTANGPGVPYAGSHTLEFYSGKMNGLDPRSIFVTPDEPLDVSGAKEVYAHVNSYGAWPLNPRSYRATITLYSGDDSISSTTEYEANVWNRVAIDVSDWEGASSVTKIKVTYAVDVEGEYSLYFDLDQMGFDA